MSIREHINTVPIGYFNSWASILNRVGTYLKILKLGTSNTFVCTYNFVFLLWHGKLKQNYNSVIIIYVDSVDTNNEKKKRIV